MTYTKITIDALGTQPETFGEAEHDGLRISLPARQEQLLDELSTNDLLLVSTAKIARGGSQAAFHLYRPRHRGGGLGTLLAAFRTTDVDRALAQLVDWLNERIVRRDLSDQIRVLHRMADTDRDLLQLARDFENQLDGDSPGDWRTTWAALADRVQAIEMLLGQHPDAYPDPR